MLALCVIGVPQVEAQATLVEIVRRHGIEAKDGLEAAFDAHAAPATALASGALATTVLPLVTGLRFQRALRRESPAR